MVALVLGAKPNPKIPQIDYTLSLYVNGAIYWSPLAVKEGCRIHYMTTFILTDHPERAHYAPRRESIVGAESDECLLVDTAPKDKVKFTLKDLKYRSNKVRHVSMGERWSWAKQIIPADVLEAMYHQVRRVDPSVDEDIDVTGPAEPRCLRPSSGVSSLIYLLSHVPDEKQVMIAGIGLEKANNHFYRPVANEERKHLYLDGLYLSVLNTLFADSVEIMTTESSVADIASIKQWDGPVLSSTKIDGKLTEA